MDVQQPKAAELRRWRRRRLNQREQWTINRGGCDDDGGMPRRRRVDRVLTVFWKKKKCLRFLTLRYTHRLFRPIRVYIYIFTCITIVVVFFWSLERIKYSARYLYTHDRLLPIFRDGATIGLIKRFTGLHEHVVSSPCFSWKRIIIIVLIYIL